MRHGKTEWNAKHKLQGRTDIPLCDEGREMARNAAKEYANVHFDICYCSPLIRAKETAEILLKGRNISIITDDRLMEMCFGEYEGMENCFSVPDCPINVLFKNPEKYVSPVKGAESLEELYSRTGSFLKEIIEPELKQNKDILIVGHGAMNCSIVCQVKGLPVEKFWSEGIDNCKLMRLPFLDTVTKLS
jgi:probable phosphoglycerate mutase